MKKLLGILIGLGIFSLASIALAAWNLPPQIFRGDLIVATSTTQAIRLPTSTVGSVLWINSSGFPAWTATSTLGIQGGAGGGITSLNGQTGSTQTFATSTAASLSLIISSATNTHTFNLQPASGYTIPLTASTTEWSNFYTTPSGRITAGTNLAWSGNTLNGTMASSTIIAGGTATHSPSITFATSTDTNILLSVVCATSTCTFNPSWTSFLSIARGGTGTSTTPSASQILLGNGTGYDYATLPSCSDSINSKLLYNNSTRTFSCGTDQSGGGGSVSGGLTGFVTTWASSTGLTYGTLRDNGTVSGVNATSSTVTFNVQGVAGLNPFVVASSTGTALLTIGQNGSTTISSLGTGIVRATSGSLYTDTNLASTTIASFNLVGNGSAIPTGATTTALRLSSSAVLKGWSLTANASCNASVDIWKATSIPTSANRIVSGSMPALSSQQNATSFSLSGWTTTFNAGDYVIVQASSTVTCVNLTLTLEGTR